MSLKLTLKNLFYITHMCVCVRAQDVIVDEWMRNTASGLLIVALNKTELNGNGKLQLTHEQKRSLTAELTLDLYATDFRWHIKKSKVIQAHQLNLAAATLHTLRHTHTHTHRLKRSQNQGSTYISFLWTGEANMTSLPPCPLWRETERNSGQPRK